jgi:hypothetical protein
MVGWVLVCFASQGSQQRKVPAHVKDDGVEVLVRPLEEGVEVKN